MNECCLHSQDAFLDQPGSPLSPANMAPTPSLPSPPEGRKVVARWQRPPNVHRKGTGCNCKHMRADYRIQSGDTTSGQLSFHYLL